MPVFAEKYSVVAVLRDDGQVAGTAFLFRRDSERCLWFTCHHVISDLKHLVLGHKYVDGSWENRVDASYEKGMSCAESDIAVLSTHSDCTPKMLFPLPLADGVLFAANENLDVNGTAYAPAYMDNYQLGVNFSAKLDREQEINTKIHSEAEKRKIEDLGNDWNVPTTSLKMRVMTFRSSSQRIVDGFSGAPVCITGNQQPICIGMVNLRAKKTAGTTIDATVVRYDDLFRVAHVNIPFFRYAACVIVVLAAKKQEMISHGSNLLDRDGNPIHEYYHHQHRDDWICFKNSDSSITGAVSSLLRRTFELRQGDDDQITWQVASVYLNDSGELLDYMENRIDPLLFIVDSCSLGVGELKNAVEYANGQYFRASYLYPICEKRFPEATKDDLRDEYHKYMPRVWNPSWVSARREECSRVEDFEKRFLQMLERAIKQSSALIEGQQDRIDSRRRSLNFPESPTRTQPHLYHT